MFSRGVFEESEYGRPNGRNKTAWILVLIDLHVAISAI